MGGETQPIVIDEGPRNCPDAEITPSINLKHTRALGSPPSFNWDLSVLKSALASVNQFCVRVCTSVYVSVCLRVRVHLRVRAHVRVCLRLRVRVRAHVRVCSCACLCVALSLYVRVCV